MVLLIGYVLDLIIGEFNNPYHIVCLIGKLISIIERLLYRIKYRYLMGLITWLLVVIISVGFYYGISLLINSVSHNALIIFNIFIVYSCLSTKGLIQASNKINKALKEGNLKQARLEVSYIVGRDPSNFDESKINQAQIETISENLNDGVIAPLFFYAIFGVPGMVLYKAINTMDSMLGYKNERYYEYGYVAAKMDDVFSYIPARLSALLLIVSSFILRLDYKNAIKIYRRDRYKHLSPNSAHPEAVVAGALNIRLGGPNIYHNKVVDKPYIGDGKKDITLKEVVTCQKLIVLSSFLMVSIILVVQEVIVWK